MLLFEWGTYNTMIHERPVYEALLFGFDRTAWFHRMNSRPFDHVMNGDVSFTIYSPFANSCPLQTDTFLFPLIHSHSVILSSNKF